MKTTVCELNVTHLWLEGDSTTLVPWIANHSFLNTSRIPLIRDIREWKSKLIHFQISHACREANQQADYLATKALQYDIDWTNADLLDSHFSYLLQADGRRTWYPREA